MKDRALLKWFGRHKLLLRRFVIAFSAAFATIAGAVFVSDVVPFLSMLDYFAAITTKIAPTMPQAAYYGIFSLLVILPNLGRYFHELDARKRDGSAKPMRASILFALVSIFALSVVLRIVYHITYKTMTPRPQPLELVAMPLLLTAVYAFIRAAFWEGSDASDDQLRRGVRVVATVREAAKAFAKESRRRRADGVSLHPSLTLPLDQERKHILLFAAPGGGKTQVIFPLLKRVLARRDPVILYDFKGDFTAALGGDEGSLILSPFDARGVRWDIATDIDTELKATEFASGLIPDDASREPFFRKAAQDLLTGVLCRLQAENPSAWTFRDLVGLLENRDEIVESCKRFRPGALNTLGSLGDKQAAGIFGELRTGTIQLEYLAKAWSGTARKISLTQWATSPGLQERHPLIIIKGHQQYQKLDGFLTAQLFAMLTKQVLSLPDSRERRIWAFLDEFGNLPRIDGLEKLLTGVRSKGLRVVAAIQDIAQIEVTYSPAFSRTFFNCFGTVLAGLNSGATAKWLSENFGRNQIERTVEGQSTSRRGGKGAGRGKTESTQQQVVIENALLDTDFSNLLPPSESDPALFWTRLGGWPIGKLAFAVEGTPQNYPSDVAPAWISALPVQAQKSAPAAPPVPRAAERVEGATPAPTTTAAPASERKAADTPEAQHPPGEATTPLVSGFSFEVES